MKAQQISRRDMVKTIGAVAGAALAGVVAASPRASNSQRLRLMQSSRFCFL